LDNTPWSENDVMMFKNVPLVLMLALVGSLFAAATAQSSERAPVAVIGTGDMGDSLGARFAELGYQVIYGTRSPDSERTRKLLERTGGGAKAVSGREAAESAELIVLAVGWPAMKSVAQNLGDTNGKVIIDISTAAKQDEDGYFSSVVETSSAEMIQQWNPGASVVKAFAVQASYVVDDPGVVGGPVSVPIAADDRAAKEQVARIVAGMGMDPFDAGPLRYAREIEAFARLYMVPLLQRRQAAWEPYFRRSYFWECEWTDEYSDPVADHGKLANIPSKQGPPQPCPGR
jgi:predicted dinucleotide-binding enzyme